jgi:hypothetical protein
MPIVDVKGTIINTKLINHITEVKEDKGFNNTNNLPPYKFSIAFTTTKPDLTFEFTAKQSFLDEDETLTETNFFQLSTPDRTVYCELAKLQCTRMRDNLIDQWIKGENSEPLQIM